ncbi:hypothetical protein MAQ5080_03325 [Marinomonas aquimarina]|uniref:UPF0178 protein MAQ5080_03325 n=1 Tax=Marinomonas aquimarina TaxID=295068 RepID=A0A1A8TPW6_9GAMM|nr:YaiI/YqxD family protein [Marinomonas aquimarina]SBS35974.1 hypothetical protein MAQ5080_03325 [Marinomonas aquimarina]
MQIWVDADACPNAIKPILFKAAERCEVTCIFVANVAIALPNSKWLTRKVVPSGFDEADLYIEQNVAAGDLVITSDIPLASDCIERGALVMTSKGEQYTRENIKQKLQMRDFMDQMRSSGFETGGSAPFGDRDKAAFANALDRLLAKRPR